MLGGFSSETPPSALYRGMNIKNDFSKGNIYSVVCKTAFPVIVAQAVSLLYGVVDRIYIGHISGVSNFALSGVGLCMPIILLINAFTNLVGLGGAPLCSIARGKGDLDYAECIMCNSLTVLLLMSVVIESLLLMFTEPIMNIFGASDETAPYAVTYMRIYSIGTIFSMIGLGMNAFINAQGFTKMGMCTTLIGSVLNIALDPVFIFVLKLGIAGAAIATVLSQLFSAMWVICFLNSQKSTLHLDREKMRLEAGTVGSILKMGVSPFITNATGSLVQTVGNVQLYKFGGDLYVGVLTVINSINQIVLALSVGFASGTQPVLGYNYGAGCNNRVKKAIRFETLVCVAYMFAVTVAVFLFPRPLIRLFSNDSHMLEAAVPAIKIYFAFFGFMGFQLVGNSVFQALGKMKEAIIFSLLRKVVIVTPLMLILPGIMGTDGVFYAESISNVIGGLCCYLTMYFTLYRKLYDS